LRFRVCVSVASKSHRRMVELARRAQQEGADLVELRVDWLRRLDQAEYVVREVRSMGIETVTTLRSSAEGEGDEVLVRLSAGSGRHMGIAVEEFIEEV
jgi:3-dehydroquinate dehydratase-1